MPSLVDEPDGGPPKLPDGVTITGFPSDFAASLVLPEGKHGVIESFEPLASDTPSGRVPVDLRPRGAGSGYEATTSAEGVHVRLGSRLSEGASLTDPGITMTPVTEVGLPLEGTGQVVGASVFYGASEDAQAGIHDIDFLGKLGTAGFSEETILRSQRSPSLLYFKLGLPEGASLSQEGAGPVLVVEGNQTVAQIIAPVARDAQGREVPVGVGVSGSTLTLTVDRPAGAYAYPIVVDPTVIDKHLATACEPESGNKNWVSTSDTEAISTSCYGQQASIFHKAGAAGYSAGQYAYWVYPTQGESHIYKWTATTVDEGGSAPVQALFLLASPGLGKEGNEVSLPASGTGPREVCAVWPSCEVGAVTSSDKNNRAFFEVRVIESSVEPTSAFLYAMEVPAIYISQEKPPQVTWDEASTLPNGKPNALAGNWVITKSWKPRWKPSIQGSGSTR